jgi:endonuclease/exonuclease/phosphatase family metal-dependent hydrolase
MQQEFRFATFNVLNLALPGMRFYDSIEPYSSQAYEERIDWLAEQMDRLDADVIGLQEVFSQAALRDVLARSRRYRAAWHVGADPQPRDGKFTPSVALVSRLPLAGEATIHSRLPRGLALDLPGMADPVNRFTRPVLQAPLWLTPRRVLHVFVVHLKSKRPDYLGSDDAGMATLRSLMRRGTDALGVRMLVSDCAAGERAPRMVLGDFNDSADAVTTRMVMDGPGGDGFDQRLFHCKRLQPRQDPLRDPGYTHVHEGCHETIDHILVSEEFHPASPHALADVVEVAYLNDHLALPAPGSSDHGAVLVKVRLRQP